MPTLRRAIRLRPLDRLREAVRVVAGTSRLLEAPVPAYDPDLSIPSSGGGGSPWFRPITEDETRDLTPLDHQRMLDVSRSLYSDNPIARRLIERKRSLVLGDGPSVVADEESVQEVLDELWDRNQMALRLGGDFACTRVYGELLLPVEVNPVDGSVTIGFIAPQQIEAVETKPNDTTCNVAVHLKAQRRREVDESGQVRSRMVKPVYKIVARDEDPQSKTHGMLLGLRGARKGGEFVPDELDAGYDGACFLWQVNKLPDQTRGTSDLLPVADYIDAYEAILFDLVERVALMNTFVGHWKLSGVRADDVNALAAQRTASVPKAGTFLFTNESEEISFLTPEWASAGVETWSDLILGVIATGAGVPKYWLNSQLDPNRASAEEMSKPVLRDIEEAQRELQAALVELCQFALDQAVIAGRLSASADLTFQVVMPALTETDRGAAGSLLQALSAAVAGLTQAELLDSETAVHLVAEAIAQFGLDIDAETIRERIEEEKERKKAEEEEAALAAPDMTGLLPGAATPPAAKPGEPGGEPGASMPTVQDLGLKEAAYPPTARVVPFGDAGRLVEHLPGKHDQKSHAPGGGVGVGDTGSLIGNCPSGRGAVSEKAWEAMEAYQGSIGVTMDDLVEGTLAVAERAFAADSTGKAGAQWYAQVRDQQAQWTDEFGKAGYAVSGDQIAGIAAALSPRTQWEDYPPSAKNPNGRPGNATATKLLVEFVHEDKPFVVTEEMAARARKSKSEPVELEVGREYRPSEIPSRALANMRVPPLQTLLANNVHTALLIARGSHPGEVLGGGDDGAGAKVRSFYNNMRHGSESPNVTIDTHMMRLMFDDPALDTESAAKNLLGKPLKGAMGGKKAGAPSSGSYAFYAEAVQQATTKFNAKHGTSLSPSDMQAMTWVQWSVVEWPKSKATAQSRGIDKAFGKGTREMPVRGRRAPAPPPRPPAKPRKPRKRKES